MLPLTRASRIVVKVGSALLIHNGQVNRSWLGTLVVDLLRLRARGQEVMLVSSGAIALGRRELKLPGGPLELPQSQAAAAVGQIALAHIYKELFAAAGVSVAQILLTLEDSEHRRRYLNARATLSELLRLGVLPVINENDTVATTEIRYGDNDRLAARVAQMTSADCLLLLSDVSGLYTADPNLDPAARLIPEIREITPEIEAMGGGSASAVGSGGMATKIAAAKIATTAGCAMAIAAGAPLHPVRRLEEGAECSWFLPAQNAENARKQWIAGSLRPSGAMTIDAGGLRRCARAEPAAGRGGRGERAIRARRYRQRARSRRKRDRARPDRLQRSRCRAHRRQTQRRHRSAAGFSRSGRIDSSRRPGDAALRPGTCAGEKRPMNAAVDQHD
jgi:glutamate 5-kinase